MQFSFSKFGSSWLYQLTTTNAKHTPALSRVVAFCITIVTKVFNPEKYACLCKILADTYNTTGTPVAVLEGWLTAVRGASLEGYDPLTFTRSQAMLATSIKGTSVSKKESSLSPKWAETSFLYSHHATCANNALCH